MGLTVREMNRRPGAVYRCFDAAGALLYIGSSVNPKARMQQHRASKWSDWTPRVARVEEEWFDSMKAAREAEGQAIWTEGPSENVQQPSVGVSGVDPCGMPIGPIGSGRPRRARRVSRD